MDEIIHCNAPWHNKVSCRHSPNSPYGFLRSLAYIFLSKESMQIRGLRCHLAIDVLGSMEGTILHKRARIPNRMGAKGYGGGYSGCQKWRQFESMKTLASLHYDTLKCSVSGKRSFQDDAKTLSICGRNPRRKEALASK